MSALIVQLAFLATAAVLGAAAGWWIRDSGSTRRKTVVVQQVSPPAATPEPSEEPADEPSADVDTVDLMMSRLQQLTTRVAEDVGQHNTRVREINDELHQASGTEANVIAVVEKLVAANEAMQSQLQDAESRLQDQAREIETHVKEARTDALTNLANRRAFDDEVARCLDDFAKQKIPASLMMFDVDHFKKFNDTYGHQAGDEVLRGVAKVLHNNVTAKQVVCRYGGEEFAIIFPGCDIRAAAPIGEQARAAIAQATFSFDGLDLRVTSSGGMAELTQQDNSESFVSRADEALYAAKQAGRNRGYWHDKETCHPLADLLAKTDSIEDSPADTPDGLDAETGLANRASLMIEVERRLRDWRRGSAMLSLLLLEIDCFEGLSGDERDRATRAVAGLLHDSIDNIHHAARYDEKSFAVVLPGAGVTESSAIAEELRASIEDDSTIDMTVSIGVAQPDTADDDSSWLLRAAASLASAQADGGNTTFASTADGECREMAL